MAAPLQHKATAAVVAAILDSTVVLLPGPSALSRECGLSAGLV